MGDVNECQAILEFFGSTRKEPLIIGSSKFIIGHTEITSGLCALLKSLAVIRTGIIPRSLYSGSLDTTLPGIKDGKLIVSLTVSNYIETQHIKNILIIDYEQKYGL